MIVANPPHDEWSRLRPALTPGELYLGDLLSIGLSAPWELYVQPHLNGLRPDFVLVHPGRGILVFEVKDWRDADKDARAVASTLAKVTRYKEEVRDLYCPSLGGPHGGHVGSHLVLPYHPRTSLLRAMRKADLRSDARIFTSEDMGADLPQELCNLLPQTQTDVVEAYQDLIHWLIEPEFSAEQREPLEVDARQRQLIQSRTTSGFRRIRGPAGSGKSLVLAARAAELARGGDEVLVVSYNITLLNYLRDLAVRWPTPSLPAAPLRDRVTWLNFHQWCKRVCKSSHGARRYAELWEGDREAVLNDEVANLTLKIMEEGCEEVGRYDAVLVDEGQDFKPSWWEALKFAVRPGGEMLLVADSSQDLYGNAAAWTEDMMEGAGFSGSSLFQMGWMLGSFPCMR